MSTIPSRTFLVYSLSFDLKGDCEPKITPLLRFFKDNREDVLFDWEGKELGIGELDRSEDGFLGSLAVDWTRGDIIFIHVPQLSRKALKVGDDCFLYPYPHEPQRVEPVPWERLLDDLRVQAREKALRHASLPRPERLGG